MRDLIERLEKASGPDRELDWRIAEKFDIPERWPTSALWPPFMPKSKYDKSIPLYTASLDAAVALVERVLPGWGRMISHNWHALRGLASEQHAFVAELRPILVNGKVNDEDGWDVVGYGPTEAVALCLALLRAKEARAEE